MVGISLCYLKDIILLLYKQRQIHSNTSLTAIDFQGIEHVIYVFNVKFKCCLNSIQQESPS